jgi:hypothetical protein
MRLLRLLAVLITGIFASWTLSYHFALVVRLPARATVFPFLAILLPLLAWSRRDGWLALHSPRREWLYAAGVLGLAGGIAFLSLLAESHNPDDYNFFHRALVQLDCLDQPFLLTETGLNPPGLPQLSILHAMTSYEPAVALAARLLGLDPLGCYQNGGAFLGVVLLVVMLVLLYHHFHLQPPMALAAALVAILYMVSDARPQRSYGNILLYGWIGKFLLWGVWLPWTLVLALRFLRRPRFSRMALLLLAGVCATGLSGSGVFLFPVEIACISLAYLLHAPLSWKRLRRAVLANAGGSYCLAIAALSLVGTIPRPVNIEVWTQGWPATWWRDLGLVFSHRGLMLRDALSVLLLPWFALTGAFARLATLLGIAVLLIVANPLTGPLWMQIVTPAAYWRFVFLLPLAWYAGLIVPSLCLKRASRLRAIGSRIAAIAAIIAIAAAGRHSYFWPSRVSSQISVKSPWEVRLPRQEAAFARLAIPHLGGRYVLGPESVCASIALLDSKVRFDAVRGTQHVLAQAGLREEGIHRHAAQRAVTQGDMNQSQELVVALRESFARGVDAVVLIDSAPVRRLVMPQLTENAAITWRPSVAGFGYLLFLRTKE